MSDNHYFTRELEILGARTLLNLHQKSVGDVHCIVWDAAIVLGKYLEKNFGHSLQKKTVVELGAGVGCAGLVAACYGANVTLTDLPDAIPILEKNIKENLHLIRGHVTTSALKWGSELKSVSPEIILMADCVYYIESVDDLINTLLILANERTQIIQAQEIRDTDNQKFIWKYYMRKIKVHFYVAEVDRSELHSEYSSDDIKVYILNKIKK